MVSWVMLLAAVIVVVAELAFLERYRQSVLTRRPAGPAAPRGRSALRHVRPAHPLAPRPAPGASNGAANLRALTETAGPDLKQDAGANSQASIGSTVSTLLQRLIRGRTSRHAARDVLYWINLAPDASTPPSTSTSMNGRAQSDDSPPDPPAPSPNAAQPSGSAWLESEATGVRPVDLRSAATLAHTAMSVEDGIVYVDAAGRFTFANQAARDLLHWTGGDLALSDVLIGGNDDSATLLHDVARQELIQQRTIWRAGPSAVPLDVSALALRDRDGNLWGAAIFIRRPAVP